MKKEIFDIYGMTCASCQAHVSNAISKLKGVKDYSVNLLTNRLDIEFDEKILNEAQIISAVKSSGYKAKLHNSNNIKKKEKDVDLIKLIIAIITLLVLMYFSMGHMINLPYPSFLLEEKNVIYYFLIQIVLIIPSLILYYSYFINGFRNLFKLRPNMDSLVSLGSLSSIIYGLFAFVMVIIGRVNNDSTLIHRYMHNLYLESSAMIITLVSLGKYLEKLSKRRTTKSIEDLVKLKPNTATLIVDNIEKDVSIEEVKKDDILIVKRGEIIPVDGIIIEGKSSIDEKNITGESVPVFKKENDEVYSSTICMTNYIKIKASKVGEDSSISTIIRLVEEASNSKAPISKLVDKVSFFFVPIIIFISILVLIFNWIYYSSFEQAINFALSTLVIACPCALGLATPVAIMVSIGKGAKEGLLIKNAEILEKAHLIKTVVLDKTGTISKGEMSVKEIKINKNLDNYEEIIYKLEERSIHPLSESIRKYLSIYHDSTLEVNEYEEIDGTGIKGTINNKHYQIGNKNLLTKDKDNSYYHLLDEYTKEGDIILFIKEEDEIIGYILLEDEIKESSVNAIKEFKKRNIEVIMLTGDNKNTATAVKNKLNIDKCYYELLPIQKQEIINNLKQDKKHLIAMVGDGVNDAIALSSSNISIAIGKGSDFAIETSDIILQRNSLYDIINVIKLSKRTYITIILNLFWAFIYNVVGILLVSGLFYPKFGIKLTPMISSLCMSFSSLFVVINALTINIDFKRKEKGKMEEVELTIKGMMCQHCVSHVEKALIKCKGVKSVTVDLKSEKAIIKGKNLNKDKLIDCVINAGYQAE
ncbi:MAG: heavy metal translocating P-type ATPase [Bacilli bacterium]